MTTAEPTTPPSAAADTAREQDPNPPVPATPSQAAMAVTLLHTVPYTLISLYFLCLYGTQTAQGMFRFGQSLPGSIIATVTFTAVIGAVLWSLFTLLSFWMDRLTTWLNLRHRALAFVLLLPSFVLGPFYLFSLVGVAALRQRSRNLLLACVPGVVAGYVCLYGALTMLSGQLALNWTNAFLIPGCTLATAICLYVLVALAAELRTFSRRVWLGIGACHLAWLAVSVVLWLAAAHAERTFPAQRAALEQRFGRPLTNSALLADYLHDGAQPTPPDSLLAKAVADGPRRVGDGRQPELFDQTQQLLLDQASYSAEAYQTLMDWSARNADAHAQMDAATTGPLFKDDLTRHGGRYEARASIASNLIAWAQIYHTRLHAMAAAPVENFSKDKALDLIRRITWLRDSAFDDPFLLANGNGVQLEVIRLAALQTLLGMGQLTHADLAALSQNLQRDLDAWEPRTARATWAALAWYTANVQDLDGDSSLYGAISQDSATSELLCGYATPMALWLRRADGRWAFDYASSLPSPLPLTPRSAADEQAFAASLPATATFSVNLLVPASSQFIAVRTLQQALLIAVACEQFRLRNGRLPDTTAQLVPDFLPTLPRDPFSGNDFVYRADAFRTTSDLSDQPGQTVELEFPQFTVYSVGWDREDNGGQSLVQTPQDNGETLVRQDLAVRIWNWTQVRTRLSQPKPEN